MTSNANALLRTVDEMLLDAGQSDASELRAALLALGSLAARPVPEPGAELAALLSGRALQPVRQPPPPRRRTSVVSLAVAAGMGLGVTGVAATEPRPGLHASSTVQQFLADRAPAWTITGGSASGRGAGNLPVTLLPALPASGAHSRPDLRGTAARPGPTLRPGTEGTGTGRSVEPAGGGNGPPPRDPPAAGRSAPGHPPGVTYGGRASQDAGTPPGGNQAGGARTQDPLVRGSR